MSVGRAKTAEPIELSLGMVSAMDPRNRVLDGYWRHLENAVKRLFAAAISWSAIRSGDAAYS